MRALMLAGLLTLTAACGAYQFPGPGSSPSPSPSSATVTGRVLAVPCAPVEQPGPNSCAGRPVPKLEIDYVGSDSVITRTVTDSNGSYFVALGPGTYSVK